MGLTQCSCVTLKPLALSGFHFIICQIRRTTLPLAAHLHLGHWESKWDGWESTLSSLQPCGHGWILLCFGLTTVFWENGGILGSSAISFFTSFSKSKCEKNRWFSDLQLLNSWPLRGLRILGPNRSFYARIRLYPWLLKTWLQINTENQHPPKPDISCRPHSESSPGPTLFLTSWLAFLLLFTLPLLLPDHSSYLVWAFRISSPSWFKWFTYSHSLYLVPSTWHPRPRMGHRKRAGFIGRCKHWDAPPKIGHVKVSASTTNIFSFGPTDSEQLDNFKFCGGRWQRKKDSFFPNSPPLPTLNVNTH